MVRWAKVWKCTNVLLEMKKCNIRSLYNCRWCLPCLDFWINLALLVNALAPNWSIGDCVMLFVAAILLVFWGLVIVSWLLEFTLCCRAVSQQRNIWCLYLGCATLRSARFAWVNGPSGNYPRLLGFGVVGRLGGGRFHADQYIEVSTGWRISLVG